MHAFLKPGARRCTQLSTRKASVVHGGVQRREVRRRTRIIARTHHTVPIGQNLRGERWAWPSAGSHHDGRMAGTGAQSVVSNRASIASSVSASIALRGHPIGTGSAPCACPSSSWMTTGTKGGWTSTSGCASRAAWLVGRSGSAGCWQPILRSGRGLCTGAAAREGTGRPGKGPFGPSSSSPSK